MSTELRPNTITLIWGFAMLPPEVLKDLLKDYSYTQVEDMQYIKLLVDCTGLWIGKITKNTAELAS